MIILSFFPVQRSASNLTYSGAEKRFIEISKIWTALGNDVHIVTTPYGDRLLHEFGYQTASYLYEPTSFKRMGINDFVNIRRMLTKIPDKTFDILYASQENFPFIIASGIAKINLRIPIVASFNLLDPDETSILRFFLRGFNMGIYGSGNYVYLKAFPRRILVTLMCHIRNFFTRDLDLIFSVGSHIKKLLVDMGVSPERIYVVSAGIDFVRIQNVGTVKKIYDACFMGSVTPRKGVADLIESWSMVVKEKPDAKLVIIGKGTPQYEIIIKQLIKKYGLQNNISALGFISSDEKYRIMKESRIFVFPSYGESFGQTICEAMACELPVVSYDLPVYHEWYRDNMLKVDKGEIKSLTSSILHLLDHKKLQKKLGYEGREIAKQYRWENVARYQLKIINQRLLSR